MNKPSTQQSSSEFYKNLPQNLSYMTPLPTTAMRQSREPAVANFSKKKRPTVADDYIPPTAKKPTHSRGKREHTFYKFIEKFYYDYDREVRTPQAPYQDSYNQGQNNHQTPRFKRDRYDRPVRGYGRN